MEDCSIAFLLTRRSPAGCFISLRKASNKRACRLVKKYIGGKASGTLFSSRAGSIIFPERFILRGRGGGEKKKKKINRRNVMEVARRCVSRDENV